MNDVTGLFVISELENVANADEAKEAALWEKKCIDKLWLRWNYNGNEKSQEILECLRPQFQLKELVIVGYSGLKLPSWMSNPSYTHLSSISHDNCINCDTLPSIGKLPSLKKLEISDMDNIRNINRLFCRNDDGMSAFPKLEKLRLESMDNLEEWTGVEDGDFPCLTHICISYCQKLCILPSFSNLCYLNCLELYECTQLPCLPAEGILPASLKCLIVSGCPKVNERCVKNGEDWLKIVGVERVYIA